MLARRRGANGQTSSHLFPLPTELRRLTHLRARHDSCGVCYSASCRRATTAAADGGASEAHPTSLAGRKNDGNSPSDWCPCLETPGSRTAALAPATGAACGRLLLRRGSTVRIRKITRLRGLQWRPRAELAAQFHCLPLCCNTPVAFTREGCQLRFKTHFKHRRGRNTCRIPLRLACRCDGQLKEQYEPSEWKN